jgi:hypothetical protein
MESLIAAALDEGERLEWFGAGAQEGDCFRITQPGEQATTRVDHGGSPEMNGLNDASPGHLEERLV